VHILQAVPRHHRVTRQRRDAVIESRETHARECPAARHSPAAVG
jgi:hypothetical protein